MSIASQRSVKSAQVKMRELLVDVNYDAGVPSVSGFDSAQIKSVIDVGVGVVTLILLRPFESTNSNLPKAMPAPIEADALVHMSASAYDRVTLTITDIAGVAADRDITVLIKGCDNRFNY